MIRTTLVLLAAVLPLCAGAQAFKCTDPATGRTLYTDQPCKGGQEVVPRRSAEEMREDAQRADSARERRLQQREAALQRERERLEDARAVEAQRPPAPVPPSESAACRAAREEASFRAASVTASEEQIRTARANAALACGQPAPTEIVVVPPARRWHPPPDRDRPIRPRPTPPRRYEPGTEPLPMR